MRKLYIWEVGDIIKDTIENESFKVCSRVLKISQSELVELFYLKEIGTKWKSQYYNSLEDMTYYLGAEDDIIIKNKERGSSMGYYMQMVESTVKIKKENIQELLNTLKQYLEYGELNCIHLNENENITIDIFKELGYEIKEDDDCYAITDFLNDKIKYDDKIFESIAPYCEDGYIEFIDGNDSRFRYVIKNKKMKIKYPIISWKTI